MVRKKKGKERKRKKKIETLVIARRPFPWTTPSTEKAFLILLLIYNIFKRKREREKERKREREKERKREREKERKKERERERGGRGQW